MPKTLPDCQSFCQHDAQQMKSAYCLRTADYAYNLGYQRQDGTLGPLPATIPENVPLMADLPPFDDGLQILEGNSPNHAGHGQNVLYVGGHVRWSPNRHVGPDRDIFVNDQNLPAPGLHIEDFVLAPGLARFDGR